MDKLQLFEVDNSSEVDIPMSAEAVRAGFPSPAQDYIAESIDLNKELVKHPATTFYARCVGDSMKDGGIDEGDLLVVDKSLEPNEGNIVVAFVDGEFTLKRIKLDPDKKCIWLMPENKDFKPIKVTETEDFVIWGVVTYNIKSQLNR